MNLVGQQAALILPFRIPAETPAIFHEQISTLKTHATVIVEQQWCKSKELGLGDS